MTSATRQTGSENIHEEEPDDDDEEAPYDETDQDADGYEHDKAGENNDPEDSEDWDPRPRR